MLRTLSFTFALLAFPVYGIAGLTPCQTLSSLQEYIDQGTTGCQLGDKVFRNFAFQFSGGTNNNAFPGPLVPGSDEVAVSASFSGLVYSLTFDFQGRASVSAHQNMELEIQFDVAVIPWDFDISNVSTTAVGAIRRSADYGRVFTRICDAPYDQFPGNGATGICESVEKNVTPATGLQNSLTANQNLDPNVVANQSSNSSSKAAFGIPFVSVYDDIVLYGDSDDPINPAGSQSAVSTVSHDFTQVQDFTNVPEPGSPMLYGTGLILIGLASRRFARR